MPAAQKDLQAAEKDALLSPVANDATNEGRALLLMPGQRGPDQAGQNAGLTATTRYHRKPLNLKVEEIEAPAAGAFAPGCGYCR